MKFASRVAVSLSPAFLWKASAEDQAVLVEWEASVDETGKEVTKETDYAVDAVYSAPSIKTVVDIGVLNVYEEPVTIFKNIPGEMVAPSAHEESVDSYTTAGDQYLSDVEAEVLSKSSKAGSKAAKAAGKSSKSVATTTSSTTTSGTTTSSTTTACGTLYASCTGPVDTSCCSGLSCQFGSGADYACYSQ